MNVQAVGLDAPGTSVGLPLRMTAGFPFKVVGSSILSLLGVYYLARGKRDGEVGSMLIGALLVIAGILVF